MTPIVDGFLDVFRKTWHTFSPIFAIRVKLSPYNIGTILGIITFILGLMFFWLCVFIYGFNI